ncbi:MAG: hybrid sensor histidine kinase/response regulator [Deltaproteobacteria bacterium HGW-Deltaproteobacteria-4]|nr:MAG: hybrid sensor histidine kinase/response regulator [Deltaproteobacteria bacterium HGW-Deltaproteobacteria-4]
MSIITNQPAVQLMAIEVISELLASTSPRKLGEALTEHLRELTGARTIMVLAHRPGPQPGELLYASPERRSTLFSAAELNLFCPEITPGELPFLPEELSVGHPLRSLLLRAGIHSLARYPLRAGGEFVALLLLFDLPGAERMAGTSHLINLLAAPIALALKNALAFRLIEEQAKELEQRVEERTAELRQSEERHRSILQTAMDGIWLIDAQGRFVEVNETYCRMSGYSMQELLSMSVSDVESFETASETSARIKKVMEQGEDRFESRHRRKDGTVYDVEVSVQYRPADGGQFVSFVQNITERKRAEEEEIKLQAQLQQAQKMESVGRLAGGVAHDFNNMLTVILGHAQLGLMRLDPNHPVGADLKEIISTAQRSADLTRQLLAFARKQTVTPKVLNLNATVSEMLKMLQRLIGEDINLSWQPAPDLGQVRIDPSQIDQILANLCVNARDAIAGNGRITIETANSTIDRDYCAVNLEAVPGEYVCLTVSDSGSGMDKETQAHIFEPFYTTKELGKGTGLGLATVYGAVKQNNGFINIYSEPGQGTTFSIYLPREANLGTARRTPDADTAVPRGQETILLVEDEPAILDIASEMLEMQGYTVLKADTPGEAIRLAREHVGEIQLLMTDVIMPEMNGRDLAKNLLSMYPHMKRLFMSGYTADVIATHGVLDDGVHFIQKPFSLPDMAAKVREVLDKP